MAYGLYPRENFPEEMEEERRVAGRTHNYDEVEAAPREWSRRGNYVEDALIAMIDKQRFEELDIV